jgi:hypothetical protein
MEDAYGPSARLKRKEPPINSDDLTTNLNNENVTPKRVKLISTEAETTFLTLPREIRQKILLQTTSDDDLLPAAALKMIEYEVEDEDQREICGVQYILTDWDSAVAFIENQMWLKQIDLVHPVITADMDWVKQEWLKRVHILGYKKQRAWELISGER